MHAVHHVGVGVQHAAAVITFASSSAASAGLTAAYAIIDERPVCSSTPVPDLPRHARSLHSHDWQRYSEKPSNTGS